jgi:adenosylcobinamide amidohydrolase
MLSAIRVASTASRSAMVMARCVATAAKAPKAVPATVKLEIYRYNETVGTVSGSCVVVEKKKKKKKKNLN